MKLKLAAAALAAIVVGYLAWGLYSNWNKKPLPPPAPVVVAPTPAAPVAPVKPAASPNKEADGL